MKITRWIAAIAVVTALGALTAWQRVSVVREGYAIAKLQREQRELQARKRHLLCEIAALSRVEALEQRLARFNRRLAQPEDLRVLGGADAAGAPVTASLGGMGTANAH